MARELILDVEIGDGNVTVDTLNFQGKTCEDIQDRIQKALSGVKVTSTPKPNRDQNVMESPALQRTKG